MPSLRTTFKLIDVPKGPNDFLSAFALGLLLPVFNQNETDAAKFDDALKRLFGSMTYLTIVPLVQELKAYRATTLPPTLSKLIDTKLKPKLLSTSARIVLILLPWLKAMRPLKRLSMLSTQRRFFALQ